MSFRIVGKSWHLVKSGSLRKGEHAGEIFVFLVGTLPLKITESSAGMLWAGVTIPVGKRVS